MKFSVKSFIKISACAVIEAALVYLIFIYKSEKKFSAQHRLSDGFFVSSVLFFTYAAFGIVVSRGAFDAVIFGFKKLFSKEKQKSYFEYVQENSSKEKKSFIVPLAFALQCFIPALILALV